MVRLGARFIDFVFIGLASMILLLPLIWLDSITRSDRRWVGLIDVLASVGFNELQLYVEHTFTYAGHEVVWREFVKECLVYLRRRGSGI